jgi:hypothetical protein
MNPRALDKAFRWLMLSAFLVAVWPLALAMAQEVAVAGVSPEASASFTIELLIGSGAAWLATWIFKFAGKKIGRPLSPLILTRLSLGLSVVGMSVYKGLESHMSLKSIGYGALQGLAQAWLANRGHDVISTKVETVTKAVGLTTPAGKP